MSNNYLLNMHCPYDVTLDFPAFELLKLFGWLVQAFIFITGVLAAVNIISI